MREHKDIAINIMHRSWREAKTLWGNKRYHNDLKNVQIVFLLFGLKLIAGRCTIKNCIFRVYALFFLVLVCSGVITSPQWGSAGYNVILPSSWYCLQQTPYLWSKLSVLKQYLVWHACFDSQSNALKDTMVQSNSLKSMTFWTTDFSVTPVLWFLL